MTLPETLRELAKTPPTVTSAQVEADNKWAPYREAMLRAADALEAADAAMIAHDAGVKRALRESRESAEAGR